MKHLAIFSLLALVAFPSNALPSIWGDIGHAISHAGSTVEHAGEQAGGAIAHTGQQAADALAHAAQAALEAASKEATKVAFTSADEVNRIMHTAEFNKIIAGVGLGMEKGMLTGDPLNIVLFGASAGLSASGILNNVKIHGYPVFNPNDEARIDIFNNEWLNLSTAEHLMLQATKNNQELEGIFVIMNKENQIKSLGAARAFNALPIPQKNQLIASAARTFKAKQNALEHDIQSKLSKIPH